MHLNTDPNPPAQPARKPCIRDMHELLRDHLPAPVVKLSPFAELERRAHEIAAEHPRFREELPLVLAGEAQRRQRLGGVLTLTYSAGLRRG